MHWKIFFSFEVLDQMAAMKFMHVYLIMVMQYHCLKVGFNWFFALFSLVQLSVLSYFCAFSTYLLVHFCSQAILKIWQAQYLIYQEICDFLSSTDRAVQQGWWVLRRSCYPCTHQYYLYVGGEKMFPEVQISVWFSFLFLLTRLES